jgi:parvulin-like peptidyl-prolyl isomerase
MRNLFILFVCIGLILSCTRSPSDPKEQIIARVNGQPVYARDFLINFHQLRAEQDDISQKNPKLMDQLKTRALNETILLNVVRQEAIKRQLRVPKEEIESRLASWKDGYPPGGFEEMLRRQNTTEDYLKRKIEDQLLLEKLIDAVFGNETLVSDDEMKKYFSEHEKSFVRPERMHAFQIVVPTMEEAEKIRQEIMAGKITFESAARNHSLSPDASKGGDLGFYAKGEKIAAFDEAFKLPIGTISKPIQSRYGVHLLKVVEKESSKKLSFNDARPDILKSLKRQKESRVYKEWITKLLKDGEIYRNEALFQNIS